ncbi:AMIN domain-containing protein [Candidatus Magnetominusculus xianensis]|nr:AMIN domain-containing protein [Candidatus Magnetominusculus xianensis]
MTGLKGLTGLKTGRNMNSGRFILTAVCLMFLCSCTIPLETTKNTPADESVTAVDLAKEPVAPPKPADTSAKNRQTGNAVTAIEVANDFINITASKPFVYRITDTSDPYKKVIDLFDVSPGRFEDIILPGSTKVADINVKSADAQKAGSVVVLTLASVVDIKDKYTENTLTLSFSKPAPETNSLPGEAVPQQKKGPLPVGQTITGIQFFKDEDKSARVEITGDGQLTPDVSTLSGKVIVDFRGLKLTAALPKDAVPPIRLIRGGQHKDKVRVVLDLSKNAVYQVDTQGDKVVVLIAEAGTTVPAAKKQPAAAPAAQVTSAASDVEDKPLTSAPVSPNKPDKSGTPKKDGLITLDYNNVDIMAVLKLIAYVSNYNIVVDPRVSGKVTIHVTDMPWEKALDLVIESNKLKKHIEGDVIKIIQGDEIHSTANVKSSQPHDLIITFTDAGGAVKTIKRANIAIGSGSICLDLASAEVQTAVTPQAAQKPVVTQKSAAAQKKPAKTKSSLKKKVKKR